MFVELLVGLALGGSPVPRPTVECVPQNGWPAQVRRDELPRSLWPAWAYTIGNRVVFRWWVCAAVEAQHANVVVEDRLLARSLFVVGHEAGHVTGIDDEVDADCYAHDRFRLLALAVGKPTKWINKMRRYLNNRISHCLYAEPAKPRPNDPKPDPRPW